MDDLHRALAERIRALASARGITISHLAARAGVGEGHFWRVLNGSATPTVAWLARVAAALGVEPWELLAPTSRWKST